MSTNITVTVDEGGFDKAFDIFIKRCAKAKILEEYRKNCEYVKPSEIKRRKKIKLQRKLERERAIAEDTLLRKSFT